jgi:hypothetical protein
MGNMPPSEPGASGAGSGPDWGEMKGKLQAARGADRMILIAGIVFFVDSFLPWYGVGFRALGVNFGSINISGWSSGGLAVLAILFAIAATLFAAARVVGAKLDLGQIKDGLIYIILGGGAFLFTILRLLTAVHYTKYGLYVALVASAFLAYGGWMKLQGENK